FFFFFFFFFSFFFFFFFFFFSSFFFFFFFQAEDGIRDFHVTGVQTCAIPISRAAGARTADGLRGARPAVAAVRLGGAPGRAGQEARPEGGRRRGRDLAADPDL